MSRTRKDSYYKYHTDELPKPKRREKKKRWYENTDELEDIVCPQPLRDNTYGKE